jgi:hypothetical protein
MRTGIGIKNIDDTELSDREDQIVRRACTGELVQAGLDLFFGSAQSHSIAEKGARKSGVGSGRTDLIGFSAREAGNPQGVAETKTLIDLGVHIGFQPIP